MADQDAQQEEGGFMDGLQTSVADISLNLELDTPPRTRRANDNSTIMMDGRMPLSPAAAEPAALHGTTKGREESAASQMQSIDDRKVDPEAAKDRLATPTSATASLAELQRQESGLSTASNMSAIQLQTPATCRGNLAESERGLLRESGGAMVCLFSQDMAPLLSVAHGIQLPRAQIGLLGACFTNCRSNSFELVTVRAGDSTISYRTVLGSQILVVVVLSSCSVGSGALLDDVLVHLHDSVWAAVGLVVSVEQLREMLEAGRIGQVRKVLKQAAGLLEELLTGRTRLHHLTLHLPAVANLTASQIQCAAHGIKDACIALRVPTPWCACVLSDGKLVCASPGWTRVRPARYGVGAGMGADAAQVEAALDQSDVLKFLLHLLAANAQSDSDLTLVPVHGLDVGADGAHVADGDLHDGWCLQSQSHEHPRHHGTADGPEADLAHHVYTQAPHSHVPKSGGAGVAGLVHCPAATTSASTRVGVAGMEASSKQGHRLLVLGLGQGPLAPSSGCCGDTSLDILNNRRRSESNVRLCVMVPGDASMWSLPGADALDHLRARLCSSLSLSGVCGPWEACQGSSTLGPATRHAHTHSDSAYGRQAGEQAVATDASSRVQVLALQCQDECQAARPCLEAQHPWLTHPWLKGLVLLRRRPPCALDLAPTGKPRARKQAGLNLLWDLEDLRVCEATQEQASLASRSKTQLPLAETRTSDTQGGLQSLLHELEWSERAVATQEPPDAQPTRLNASGVQASVDGVGSNASQESADTPARSQADSHILLRGIMEALDARALAERRGTLCSAAAPSNDIWSVRVYFGLDVVHGLWLEGGASALFALIRHPLSSADPGRQAARRVVHNDNDTQPMSFGEPNLTAASGTPPTPAPEFADSIQWHTLVKSLQNLSLDLHCPKLGPK